MGPQAGLGKVVRTRQACCHSQDIHSSSPSCIAGHRRALLHSDLITVWHPWDTAGRELQQGQQTGNGHSITYRDGMFRPSVTNPRGEKEVQDAFCKPSRLGGLSRTGAHSGAWDR